MKNTTSRQIPKQQIAHQLEYIEQVSRRNALLPEQQWFFCQTFGCQQNEADTERIAGMLRDMGYQRTEDYTKANVIVVNTCAVREHAEKRVFGMMGKYTHLKDSRDDLVICMCGCMVQQEHITEKIKKSYPRVDIVFGTHMQWRFPELLLHRLSGSKRIFEISGDPKGEIAEGLPVQRGEGCHAWLSIMYGCNNFCTYCIVPYVRGRERSRSIENIVEEVEQAVANGYKEFTLLGQNVNSYGKDFGEKGMFAKLLRRVNDVPGVERIRYMTSHPRDMGEDVIQAVAECEHICENFHVPFQAGSSRILKMMNRGYTREQYLELVKMIRRYVPDAAITTDIIVGFPGETEEDFEETLSLVKEVGFDAAYTFIYSKRSGTPAAKMEGQVPLDVKKARLNRLMAVQNENSLKRNEEMVGKTYEVLAEGPSANNPNVWSGRTRTNKLVLWPTEGRTFTAGQKVNVKICNAQTWLVKGQAE